MIGYIKQRVECCSLLVLFRNSQQRKLSPDFQGKETVIITKFFLHRRKITSSERICDLKTIHRLGVKSCIYSFHTSSLVNISALKYLPLDLKSFYTHGLDSIQGIFVLRYLSYLFHLRNNLQQILESVKSQLTSKNIYWQFTTTVYRRLNPCVRERVLFSVFDQFYWDCAVAS